MPASPKPKKPKEKKTVQIAPEPEPPPTNNVRRHVGVLEGTVQQACADLLVLEDARNAAPTDARVYGDVIASLVNWDREQITAVRKEMLEKQFVRRVGPAATPSYLVTDEGRAFANGLASRWSTKEAQAIAANGIPAPGFFHPDRPKTPGRAARKPLPSQTSAHRWRDE